MAEESTDAEPLAVLLAREIMARSHIDQDVKELWLELFKGLARLESLFQERTRLLEETEANIAKELEALRQELARRRK